MCVCVTQLSQWYTGDVGTSMARCLSVCVCIDVSGSSMFELSRLSPRDYWHWIHALSTNHYTHSHDARSLAIVTVQSYIIVV